MKNTILINLQGIAAQGWTEKTDLYDWIILDFIKDLGFLPWVSKYISKDRLFVRVSYHHLLNELPILKFKTRQALYERLEKLVEIGLLLKEIRGGKETYFSLTDDAIKVLLFSEQTPNNPNPVDKPPTEFDKMSTAVYGMSSPLDIMSSPLDKGQKPQVFANQIVSEVGGGCKCESQKNACVYNNNILSTTPLTLRESIDSRENTEVESKEKEKEKEKEKKINKRKEKEKEKEGDFVETLLEIFCKVYKDNRDVDYILLNKGKERQNILKVAKGLEKFLKSRGEVLKTEEFLERFEEFLRECFSVRDDWRRKNISPSILNSHFNMYIKDIYGNNYAYDHRQFDKFLKEIFSET